MVTNKRYRISGFTSVRGARSHPASLKHTDGCPRTIVDSARHEFRIRPRGEGLLVPE
jgi:hypothetical protein